MSVERITLRYVFDGPIIKDNVVEFFNWTNSVHFNDRCHGIIYLNSPGGETEYGRQILEYLDYNKDFLTLVAMNSIQSSAFYVFLAAKCKKRISKNLLYGLCHLASLDINALDIKFKESPAMASSKALKRINKGLTKFYKKYLTPKQFKDFKKGYDIVIPRKQLIKMI